MVFVDVGDTRLGSHEPETHHRSRFRNLGVESASRGSDASLLNLRYRLRVGIEPADQHVPVFFCACCKVRNKGLDQISIRFLQGWGTAEIGGVRLDESGVEIVLADQETELIA